MMMSEADGSGTTSESACTDRQTDRQTDENTATNRPNRLARLPVQNQTGDSCNEVPSGMSVTLHAVTLDRKV